MALQQPAECAEQLDQRVAPRFLHADNTPLDSLEMTNHETRTVYLPHARLDQPGNG